MISEPVRKFHTHPVGEEQPLLIGTAQDATVVDPDKASLRISAHHELFACWREVASF
jgi:alpha-ketoglutarate-dependent taurine dioxygenase